MGLIYGTVIVSIFEKGSAAAEIFIDQIR